MKPGEEKNEEALVMENDSDDGALDSDVLENKFLTFKIKDEQYGVGIEYVMEIIEMIKITPMPEMHDFIKGVINLRGKVIPVMSVRLRFGLEEKEYDAKTCIIVVKLNDLEIGLIVDTVCEVLEIPQDQIQPPPKLSKKEEQRFVMGMGKVGDEVNILLDVAKLLMEDDILKKIA